LPNRLTTLTNVRTLLQIPGTDNQIYDNDITDVIIDLALQEFSIQRPRFVFADYVGNSEYNRELPAGWQEEFSVIKDVSISIGQQLAPVDPNEYYLIEVDETEYVINSVLSGATSITLTTPAQAGFFKKGDVIRIKHTVAGVETYETNWASANGNTSTGVLTLKNAAANAYATAPRVLKRDHIRFLASTPVANDHFVVKYTALHSHDDISSTVPAQDYGAFCHLVAALTAFAIAAKFSKHTTSTHLGDAVDYQNLATLWGERAQEQRKLYLEHFSGPTTEAGASAKSKAGGAWADLDTRMGFGGKRFLYGGKQM